MRAHANEPRGRTRASSYSSYSNTPFAPSSGVISTSYHDRRIDALTASFTPTYDREMRFDERDDENDESGAEYKDDDDDDGNAPATDDDDADRCYYHPARAHKTSTKRTRRNSVGDKNTSATELSRAQKQGCFNYIKRRHSIALAFASNASLRDENSPFAEPTDAVTNWEYAKTKHGVTLYKSKRSRCEVRAVTRVNSSVKNVMVLLAAGETTENFAHAQNALLGEENVLEARVLASCVPSTASRFFHCGLKYLAMKNPFGVTPLDLVFLDYTDVSTTPDGKLVGYRIMESIRVPEYQAAVPKYVRASLRCEVYVVRETEVSGVVEVTFASHLDPKSKYSSSKRTHWLEQAGQRLRNLRSYAEKASLSHKLILEKGKWIKRDARHHCFVCDASFSFLRTRHNCRLCGEVTCGRCSRKLPILVANETTRVRVCLRCILDSRHQPDELGRSQVAGGFGRRGSVGNSTYIAYDEIDPKQHDDHE
jgi:hypothetical protein